MAALGDDEYSTGSKRSRSRGSSTLDDGEPIDDDHDDDDNDDEFEPEDDWQVQVLDNPEQIQVDLELFNLEADDYFSVKHFLVPLLEGASWDASDMAQHIADHMSPKIGTTIRVDGGREPYGFLSVVNLHRTAHLPCTRQIVRFMLDKITNKSQNQQLRHILESKNALGLVLNERVVNVPGQIAPPLHLGFWEEVEEAAELEQNNGEAPYFDFEYYIMITTVAESISDDSELPRGKKIRDASKQIDFLKPEDEVYTKNSTFAFSYPVTNTKHGKWTMGGTIKSRKVIILWHKSALPNIISQLSELSTNPSLFHPDSPPLAADDEFVNPLNDE